MPHVRSRQRSQAVKYRTAHLPKHLKPAGLNQLVRVGSTYDGGYIVATRILSETKSILTFGLGLNWDFERQMNNFLNLKSIHCYDHTVSYSFLRKTYYFSILKYFINNKKRQERISAYLDYKKFFNESGHVKHFVKEIALSNDENRSTVDSAFAELNMDDGVFLKCDIEGAEYGIGERLIANAPKCVGIALEFHDVKERMSDFIAIIDGLLKTHIIDHIHANTYSLFSDTGVPSVVEVSMSRRNQSQFVHEDIKNFGLKKVLVGADLDKPNNKDHSDIRIVFDL
jgi:hypothetical protein